MVRQEDVHNALLSGDAHDQLAIAYHLIVDNKRIADEAAKADIREFYSANSPPPILHGDSSASPTTKIHPERFASMRDNIVSNEKNRLVFVLTPINLHF